MRLTKEMVENGKYYLSGLAEVSNSYHKGYGRIQVGHAVEKLAEYEDLEEQGKLLKLPCAVGDTVYEVQDLRKRIQPYAIIAAYDVDAVLMQLHNAGGCDGSTEYAKGWDDAMEEAERIVKAGRKSDVKAGWKEHIARRFGRVE